MTRSERQARAAWNAAERAAWRAWTRGDIDAAARLAAGLTQETRRAHLLFLTDYARGRYEQALAHYTQVGLARSALARLDEPVANAWLHLGQPGEALAHLQRRNLPAPPDLRLRAERPLGVELNQPTAVLPFADQPLAPFLPAVAVTIDGHPVLAHLDTGGTFVVMGTERAAALGIHLVPNGRSHHGTTKTDFYIGTAAELVLGDAVLTNVPVEVAPTLRGGQDLVLVGTNVLQQFLATIDGPGQRLLLSPRELAPASSAEPSAHLSFVGNQAEIARMPFHLWGDHYMFARGGLGSRDDLNFFIDSGLVYVVQDDDTSPPRQACLYATAAKYRDLGVPRAQASGPHFAVDGTVRLGTTSQAGQLAATAPGRRVPWSSFGGVRIDGLLSHAFLNAYTWTLDFDRFEYVFRSGSADLEVGLRAHHAVE